MDLLLGTLIGRILFWLLVALIMRRIILWRRTKIIGTTNQEQLAIATILTRQRSPERAIRRLRASIPVAQSQTDWLVEHSEEPDPEHTNA